MLRFDSLYIACCRFAIYNSPSIHCVSVLIISYILFKRTAHIHNVYTRLYSGLELYQSFRPITPCSCSPIFQLLQMTLCSRNVRNLAPLSPFLRQSPLGIHNDRYVRLSTESAIFSTQSTFKCIVCACGIICCKPLPCFSDVIVLMTSS